MVSTRALASLASLAIFLLSPALAAPAPGVEARDIGAPVAAVAGIEARGASILEPRVRGPRPKGPKGPKGPSGAKGPKLSSKTHRQKHPKNKNKNNKQHKNKNNKDHKIKLDKDYKMQLEKLKKIKPKGKAVLKHVSAQGTEAANAGGPSH